MIRLAFPEPQFKTRYEGDIPQVFDSFRKKWVALTPEEWVRQNILQWLVNHTPVPASHIAIERSIEVGGRPQRFDVLIYDHEQNPWMLIECKSQVVQLNEKALMQVLRYNSAVPVKYIMVTNGEDTFVADHANGQVWLDAFPSFQI